MLLLVVVAVRRGVRFEGFMLADQNSEGRIEITEHVIDNNQLQIVGVVQQQSVQAMC